MTDRTAERVSKGITATVIALFVLVVVFNLGRADVLAKARKCQPDPVQFGGLPFKGTIE